MSIDIKAIPEDVEVYQDGNTTTIVVKPLAPKTLAQCIEWIENRIDPALRRKVEVMPKISPDGISGLYHSLGVEMVAECDFWHAGCSEVVADISRLMNAGVKSEVYNYFGLNFNPSWRDLTGTNFSVYHPDNCAGVVLDYYQELITGNIGLALIERKG